MIFTAISDVHVKNNYSKEYQLLLSFLGNRKVVASSAIYFLGDIFDLMVGNHKGYFRDYKEFFDALEILIRRGVKIHYVEGNHDFHIKELFESFVNFRKIDRNFLIVHETRHTEIVGEKKILFAHGDEFVFEKMPWPFYRSFIKSKAVKFIANNLVSYGFLQSLGKKMSFWSRSRNQKKEYNKNPPAERLKFFRENIESIKNISNYDYVILGHSHLQDCFVTSKGLKYYNLGDPRETSSFLYFDSNGDVSFNSI